MPRTKAKRTILPVILFDDTGDLGNRLTTYAHLLAFSLDYKANVVNLCFWRYRPHLKWKPPLVEAAWRPDISKPNPIVPRIHSENCRICRFRLGRFFHKRMTIGHELFVHPSLLFERMSAGILRTALRCRIFRFLTTRAFQIVDSSSDGHRFSLLIPRKLGEISIIDGERVMKHSEIIRKQLAFRSQYVGKAQAFIEPCRNGQQPQTKIIAVHVRRGDYRHYRGGKFYIEDSVYKNILNDIKVEFKNTVQIILASNEDVSELEDNLGMPVLRAPDHPITTLCILGECDLIVGPPSTFSGWASFMAAKSIKFLSSSSVGGDLLVGKAYIWTPRWY